MRANENTTDDDVKASTHNQRRLTIARDLLADTVGHNTKISLYGLRLRRHAVGSIWTVTAEDLETPVDHLNVEAMASATELLEHIETLRDRVDGDGGDL